MKLDDYTTLPVGERVDGGVIAMCPVCGSPGLMQEESNKTFYTHKQWVKFTELGTPEMGWTQHVQDRPVTPPKTV